MINVVRKETDIKKKGYRKILMATMPSSDCDGNGEIFKMAKLSSSDLSEQRVSSSLLVPKMIYIICEIHLGG